MADPARAATVLGGIPFIQRLEAKDSGIVKRLAEVALFDSHKKDTVVFRQGDPGSNCYIVVSGEIGVLIFKGKDIKGTPTPRLRFDPNNFPTFEEAGESAAKAAEDDISRPKSKEEVHFRFRVAEGFSTFTAHSTMGEQVVALGKGTLFGELALMNNAPRASSIKCNQDCELLMIKKEDYHRLHNDFLQASELQVIEDFCSVLAERCGSVVRAWRISLDPHAVGELLFSEFVEALTSMQWQGNTSALWGALCRRASSNNRDLVVGLREIAPEQDHIIEQFKFWMGVKFGGAVEMFYKLTVPPDVLLVAWPFLSRQMFYNLPTASLKYNEFMIACQGYGEPEHLKIVWEYLDPEKVWCVSLKDMAFLEINGLRRKAAMDPSFVMALEAAKSSAMSLRKRSRLQQRAQHMAMTEFMRKLKAASGGSFIRGFRKILDQNGNLNISKVEMLKGCRQVAFGGDVMALWKAMDSDGDGCVQLPELDVRMALVLASFKKWCLEKHEGSSLKAINHLAAITRKRTSKWSAEEFIGALSLTNYPGVLGMISVKQAAAMLHEAGDLTGHKYIVAQDLSFLDDWDPSPWLCAEPDVAGKDAMIAMLRSRYVNLIVAWRRLFDRNNKNHVTFKDFVTACNRLQIENVPGIWRALDAENLGFISLKNIHNESHSVLVNFKEWAEETFGSITFAFRVFSGADSEHPQPVSPPVFKRVLSAFGFQGDVRSLFQSLKPDAGGRGVNRDARLKLDDMKHLSSWVSTSEAIFEDDDEVEPQQADLARGKSQLQVSRTPSKLSLGQESVPIVGFGKCLEDSTPGGTLSQASRGIGSSRSYSTTSDFFLYCRGTKEHELFCEVRTDHVKRGMVKRYELGNPCSTQTASGRFQLPPSPYGAPVLSTGFAPLAKFSGRPKMMASVSLPTLSGNAGRGVGLEKIPEVPRSNDLDAGSDSAASSEQDRLPIL